MATFGGLRQISLKVGKAIRNLKQMFVSKQGSKTSGKRSVEISSWAEKRVLKLSNYFIHLKTESFIVFVFDRNLRLVKQVYRLLLYFSFSLFLNNNSSVVVLSFGMLYF